MSPLVRKHSISAGSIEALAATRVRDDMVVTAVRTTGGTLKLIVWELVGDELVRRGDASGGTVANVSICRVGHTRVCTSCRDGSGSLLLRLWDVTEEGEVQHRDTASAGAIGRSAPIGLGPSVMATPVTDSNGELKVIAWGVSDAGGLTRRGDASGGAADLVATDNWGRRFITALRNASGNLELIHWVVQDTGQVDRLGEIAAGAVSGIGVIRHHSLAASDHQIFMTAVRDGSGKLKLIAWRANAEGSIERLGDLATDIGCSKPSVAPLALGRHVVAFVDSANELRIQCFRWGQQSDPANPGVPTGQAFTLAEEGSGGTASLVAAADVGNTGCVTAVRDANGNLKVILWNLE